MNMKTFEKPNRAAGAELLLVYCCFIFVFYTLYDGVLADNKPKAQTANDDDSGGKLTG